MECAARSMGFAPEGMLPAQPFNHSKTLLRRRVQVPGEWGSESYAHDGVEQASAEPSRVGGL